MSASRCRSVGSPPSSSPRSTSPSSEALEPGVEVEHVRRAGDHDGVHRRAGDGGADDGQHPLPGDQRLGAGVGELGGELGRREQRVGGGEDGPGHQHAVVDGRVLPAVGQVDGDDVPAADAAVGQRVGDGRARRPSSVKVSGHVVVRGTPSGHPSGAPPPAGSSRPGTAGSPATAAARAASWRRIRWVTAWRSCAPSRVRTASDRSVRHVTDRVEVLAANVCSAVECHGVQETAHRGTPRSDGGGGDQGAGAVLLAQRRLEHLAARVARQRLDHRVLARVLVPGQPLAAPGRRAPRASAGRPGRAGRRRPAAPRRSGRRARRSAPPRRPSGARPARPRPRRSRCSPRRR